MSNTTETDKNTWSDSSDGVLYNVVTADFARKLELERDELQKKYDTLAAENMLEVHKLCKERDEWRECAYQLHATVMYLMPDLMQQEYGFSGEKKSVLKFEQLAKNCK